MIPVEWSRTEPTSMAGQPGTRLKPTLKKIIIFKLLLLLNHDDLSLFIFNEGILKI